MLPCGSRAGSGADVVVTLAAGTQITFVGRGTGAVDTWADLVAHSLQQLKTDTFLV